LPPSGFWTELKLLILARYLTVLATASKSAWDTLYLDLFAGVPVHQRRDDPTQHFTGSAVRAMGSQPPLSCLRFMEMNPKNVAALQQKLQTDFPNDNRYKLITGDCNQTIDQVLRALISLDMHRSPSLAFIDPYGLHAKWSTLVKLAEFRAHPKGWKTELLILFPDTVIPRLDGHDHSQDTEYSAATTEVYGSEAWREIANRRRQSTINPPEARRLYVDLYRHKIQNDLGYNTTYALSVGDEVGKPVYHMIYATDHPVGKTAMKHVYQLAVDDYLAERNFIRANRDRSQREQDGAPGLFDETPEEIPEWHMPYEHFYENDPQIPDWLLSHLDWPSE